VEPERGEKYTNTDPWATVMRQHQAGTVRIGDYDALGRLLHDRVTALGSGRDSTVHSLSLTYNLRGLLGHVAVTTMRRWGPAEWSTTCSLSTTASTS
jgi:hypothetical protein